MNNRPIGIFDSGVGGLTVVRAVLEHLPEEDIIYYGDTARFPYGPKDLRDVRGFVFEIAQYLIDQGVKIIVIACNTGTAAGLVDAQRKFDIPIIGVVEPGARGAALATVDRRVGVIGTEGTIASGTYQRAIEALDAGIKVTAQACPRFVEFAESGETEGPAITAVAEEYLASLKKSRVDTVILGCTHYPLLTEVIQKVMGPDVKLISSATETATEVEENLTRRGYLAENKDGATHRFIVSGDTTSVHDLVKRFLGRDGESVEQVVIG
ncbi:MAG: glutamate racemase [Actinomycetota bacterium]